MPRLYVTFADVCACAVPWIEASRVLLVTTAGALNWFGNRLWYRIVKKKLLIWYTFRSKICHVVSVITVFI